MFESTWTEARPRRHHKTSHHIDLREGSNLFLRRGDFFRIVDPVGGQIADLFAVAQDDPQDGLSADQSFLFNETNLLGEGHKLYSSRGRIFFEILEDSDRIQITPNGQIEVGSIHSKPGAGVLLEAQEDLLVDLSAVFGSVDEDTWPLVLEVY
jgi:uncharacterized protein YcgI (DUF1989 family)